jgi:putative spermidine/putrescine transport system ATP-binding protein
MTTSTSSVRLDSITKTFRGGITGIDDISLAIEAGEFVTFLGPSGSGKSTTLNTIAGFVSPTSGRIEIGDIDVTDLAPNKRNLGMVFQNYALFPHMSVRDNVAFGLHGRGLSKTEVAQRIDDALAMVKLTGFGGRTPKQISGGQQQRVALARALVYRPPVLLMDEPLGALDKKLRDSMQVEIGRLHRELGTTFLFVTHDQDEALALSDRIALFDNGKVLQIGSPAELYERPRSLFVAEFLGESNVFRGVVNGVGRLRFGAGSLRFAHSEQIADGQQAAVVVRPERMRISTGGDASIRPSGTNTADATVTDLAYFGSYRRVGLRYDDGAAGIIREQVGMESPVSLGQAVAVEWAAEDSVAVPWETSA